MKTLLGLLLLASLWLLFSLGVGGALVPPPWAVAVGLFDLLSSRDNWGHMAITLARILGGLALSLVLAYAAGVAAGLYKPLVDVLSPLVFAAQACPTIIWVALLMVWTGSGNAVPVTAIVLAAFPVIFMAVFQATANLDHKLFEMARIFRVPPAAQLKELIMPGIAPYVFAGFSYAVSVSWKVAAMAEYLASDSGIGSRVYWSFRMLNIIELFSWAVLMILFALATEAWLIKPARRNLQQGQHA